MKRTKWSTAAIVAVLILVMPLLMAQSSGRSVFSRVIADTLTVKGDTIMVSDLTVGDDITADAIVLTSATLVTLTNGGTLAVTDGYQPIAAAGGIGASMTCVDGLVSRVVNTVAQTITFTDTGTVRLASNFGMTQYDVLTVIGVGTDCYEIARSAN